MTWRARLDGDEGDGAEARDGNRSREVEGGIVGRTSDPHKHRNNGR